MRYLKDSFTDQNPRAKFWKSQNVIMKNTSTLPFSFYKYLYNWQQKVYVQYFTLKYQNVQLKEISKYFTSRARVSQRLDASLLAVGIVIGSLLTHFNNRLFKERKWDEEPGAMIPIQTFLFKRIYTSIITINYVALLYYVGLYIEDKDLAPNIDLTQISQGRIYRRFLVRQYCRKQEYSKKRKGKYDFLEISPEYARN
jgi:hypothetical protein